MGYLITGFLCSAMVSLVLKVSGKWEYDRYGMLTINYIACLIPFLITQSSQALPAFDGNFRLCIISAAVNGFLYLGGMVMNQINVRRNGAILQSTFARLGVMVPTCLSIFFFGERPSAIQGMGIIMVAAAFLIMNIQKSRTDNSQSPLRPAFSLLFLGMLFGGAADSMLKIFEVYGDLSLDDWFMGLTFLFSAIICLVITIRRKERIGRNEIIIGLFLGIPNYLSSLLLLKSLSTVSAYIAYPTYSVGAILAVTAASIFLFRERISKWSWSGIAVIIPAIILLNL